jgi:hypothetical protein
MNAVCWENAVSQFWHFVHRTDPASDLPMISFSIALPTIACASDPTDEMRDRRLSSASMIARTSIP